MDRGRRIVAYYLAVMVGSVLLFTVVYDAGMSVFENRPRTFVESLEVVMQTYTTVGYGQDAPWRSLEMSVLTVLMQGTSLVLIFAAFPVVIVPLLEDALTTTAPTERTDLSDHVVVCGHNTRTAALVDELDVQGVPYVVVEPDRDRADELYAGDTEVVHGDPTTVETFHDVGIDEARAAVSDSTEGNDISIVMSIREAAPDLPVYSVAESADVADYHRRAGVDRVFSPRTLLGKGLANKVRDTVRTELDRSAVAVGDDVDIGELAVRRDAGAAGKRVRELELEARTGARLIGAWSRGEFRTPPFPDLRLDGRTVLLAVGSPNALEALERLVGSSVTQYGRGAVVVAGFGVVGSTVTDVLAREDTPFTVVDAEDGPSVDVVGDVTDEQTLEKADLAKARTVVLALDDDTTTLLATFVVREVAPDVEIVARADETESVNKLYRAGCDYVLALATVTGRLLASAVTADDRPVTVDEQVRVVRRPPGPLAGETLGDARLRERTGCTVVALEHRDGRIGTDLQEWTEIAPTDALVVAGTARDLDRLSDLVGSASDSAPAP
jgi:Trk K+ transport system NAD-binding subunit